jgi:hypothetical protein
MRRAIPRRFAFMGLFFLATVSQAGAPPYIPVQGFLTDAQDIPVKEVVDMRFAIYDQSQAGIEIWSESQAIPVEDGIFTAYLGQQETLDLIIFKSQDDLWLGIQVGTDQEMSRIQLGSIPYAGYSEHSSYTAGSGVSISAGNVISGALGDSIESEEITDGTIQLADLSQNACATNDMIAWNGSAWACTPPPSGSDGIPSGAVMTFNLTSCPPGWSELTDARGRALVGLPDPGSLAGTFGTALGDLQPRNVTEVSSHAHQIAPPAAATGDAGSHAHGIDDPGHRHQYAVWQAGGSGLWAPVPSVGNQVAYNTGYSNTGITIQSGGVHSHAVDIAPFDSASVGVGALDVSMPYIQLLVCQKD